LKDLLMKEFKWNWRSFRYPAFLLLLLFFALLNPPSTKYMNEILEMFAEGFDASLLPEPSAVEAYAGILGDFYTVGLLVLIFILMGSVAGEKESGVTGWILSKPVSRWSYLHAKMVLHAAVVIVGVAVMSAVGYLYTWSLLEQVSLAGAFWATLALIVYMLLFTTIVLSLSAILKSPLQAGGLTALIYALSGALNLLMSQVAVGRFYPNTLLGEIPLLIRGVSGPGEVWGAILITLLLSFLIYFLAGSRFQKMEQH